MIACDKCSNYGKIVERAVTIPRRTKDRRDKKIEEKFEIDIEFELIPNYGKAIKEAREKSGIKQDELGRMINEPASLIHRIETERIEPSIEIAKKIQRALHIRILKPIEIDNENEELEKRSEMTLGDVVVIRKKRR